jgi:hypothetical protein
MTHASNGWGLLFRTGALGAFAIVLMVPIQIVFYVIWPPSFDVTAVYATFEQNWFRGLESLDILLLLDSVFNLPFFLALAVALWPQERSLAVLAVAAVLTGTAAYFNANTSLELFDLSRQFAASDDTQTRSEFLAAGRFALAHFQGTGFAVYYLLGGAATLLASVAMLRGRLFGRVTGSVGGIAGLTMLVPPLPATGQLGLILSLLSLVPLLVWLVLAGRRLWSLPTPAV